MGRAMFSKSSIQFSVDGLDCVPFLLLDLRPNYGGGDDDIGDLLQKVPCTHCCTQCPQPCSRPLLTHASTRDSWTLTGKSGSVSCGFTAPFSWAQGFSVPSKSLFPQSCVSSGGCMVEFNGNSLLPPRGLMPYRGLLHPEPLQQAAADLHLHGRHSDTVLAWSLWVGCAFCALPRSEQLR